MDPKVEPIPKTRWVVQGFLERFLSFFRKDAPTGSQESLGVVTQFVASMRMALESADIKNAYLSGVELARSVYIKVPKGGIGNLLENEIVRAKKGLYGLVDAARQFFLYLRSFCNMMC